MSPPADLPEDDSPIADDTPLYRLVPLVHCDVVDGRWEFQSAAFDNNEGLDMSVVLGDTLEALERKPAELPHDLFSDQQSWGVAAITAGDLRHEAQEIVRTPRPEEPAHGDVRGPKNGGRRKRIKRLARWEVRPLMAVGK